MCLRWVKSFGEKRLVAEHVGKKFHYRQGSFTFLKIRQQDLQCFQNSNANILRH